MSDTASSRLKEEEEEEASDYESCGEEIETNDRDADLTRPSDWTPHTKEQLGDSRLSEEEDSGGGGGGGGEREKGSVQGEGDGGEEEELDSAGEEKDSPYFVDEGRLTEEGEGMSEQEAEGRREQAGVLKQEGNSLYKEGKHKEALEKYTNGLQTCPIRYSKERAVMYANRGQVFRVTGEKDKAIRNCTKAIELDPSYLKAILRRAELYEDTEKLDEALEDYKRVLELDPSNPESRRAVMILPQKIEERNEKLKEEMMVNLKKLGNMVLKPFGLSTENFNMVQDPNTGGYNIQFSQNNK